VKTAGDQSAEEPAERRFAAAVAFYPNCRVSSGVMTVPLLILIGGADDWTPAAACRAMLTRRAGRGAMVALHVYPGATHAFDVRAPARTVLGHRLRYDPAATRDAWLRVRRFLEARLGRG
jgi:dienelactone hydrolase